MAKLFLALTFLVSLNAFSTENPVRRSSAFVDLTVVDLQAFFQALIGSTNYIQGGKLVNYHKKDDSLPYCYVSKIIVYPAYPMTGGYNYFTYSNTGEYRFWAGDGDMEPTMVEVVCRGTLTTSLDEIRQTLSPIVELKSIRTVY